MYVKEQHLDGHIHTHIVFWAPDQHLWRQDKLTVNTKQPNMKRLRKADDVYRSMAYLAKERVPTLWCAPGTKPRSVYEHVLGALWNYKLRWKGSDKTRLENQYQALRQAWFPPKPEGEDQYSSSLVASENPSQFFD